MGGGHDGGGPAAAGEARGVVETLLLAVGLGVGKVVKGTSLPGIENVAEF